MSKLTEQEEEFLSKRANLQKRFRFSLLIATVILPVIYGMTVYVIFHLLNLYLKDPGLVPMGIFVRLFIANTLLMALTVFIILLNLLREKKFIEIIQKLK